MSLGQPSDLSRRKAWLGAAFMDLVCADAGFAWEATASEKDIHSIDGSIKFWTGHSTPVQVKTTANFARSKSYRIKPAWRTNWADLRQPGYFVVVTVPNHALANPGDVSGWLYHHQDKRTLLECSAYWQRIDQVGADVVSVQVTTGRRLTTATIHEWRDAAVSHVDARFGG